MLRVDTAAVIDRLGLGVQRQAERAGGEEPDAGEVMAGLRVSLSELGRTRAAAKNDDIDESGLPDSVKEILKLIRALKQQIAEKQDELKALMAEPGLDPETRRLRVEALQTELAGLQGALSAASANLIKVMREAGLSGEQMQTAAKLAMG
ncbi:MAG: hypothetical protein ACRCTL_17080 [Pseudomonas sp.]